MEFQENETAYLRAQKRVEKLRNFYLHLVAYLAVNIIISSVKVTRNMDQGETFAQAFLDIGTFILWLLWGIGLALHAFSVFGLDKFLGKNWEERKIEQFMEEEQYDNF